MFAKLKERDPAAAEALGDLGAEHENLSELTRRFAEAVDSLLADAEMPREAFDRAVRDFIERQRHHMAVEEEKFFPQALKALSEGDWSEIDGQLVDRDDPLFGAEVEDRFRDLRNRILQWESEGLSSSGHK